MYVCVRVCVCVCMCVCVYVNFAVRSCWPPVLRQRMVHNQMLVYHCCDLAI